MGFLTSGRPGLGLSVGLTTSISTPGGAAVQMNGESSYAFQPTLDFSVAPVSGSAIVDYLSGDPQMPVVLGYGGYLRGSNG